MASVNRLWSEELVASLNSNELLLKKEGLKCSAHMAASRINPMFLYTHCSIYLLPDRLVITGYIKILSFKIYSGPRELYFNPLKNTDIGSIKINPFSFGNGVFISYRIESVKTTIDLRIKGFTTEEKQLLDSTVSSYNLK